MSYCTARVKKHALLYEINILEFPLECTSYEGPHLIICLDAIWIDVGCLAEGREAPSQSSHLSELNFKNLR